jgi:transcription elongation factor Elf1
MTYIDKLLYAADKALAEEERRRQDRREHPNLPKIECPKCHEWHSVVKEGRPDQRGYRRIRACKACGHRFQTIERAA